MRRLSMCFNLSAVFSLACIMFAALYAVPCAAEPGGLHDAVRKGDMAAVGELVASGADIDLPDGDGVTPLMLGAKQGDYYIVTMLLTAGADTGLRDTAGRTALMYAAENGHVYVGRALLAAGADPDARDRKGFDAEELAMKGGHSAMTESLRTAADERERRLDSMRKELQSLYGDGRYEEAAKLGERILASRMRPSGKDSMETAAAAQDLGVVYEAIEDYTRAKGYYQLALGTRERALGPENPLTAETLASLGALEFRMGNLKKAEAFFSRALSINEAAFGPGHPVTARSMRDMAALLERSGRKAESVEMMKKAEKTLGTPSITGKAASGPAGLLPRAAEKPPDTEKERRRPGTVWVVLAVIAALAAVFLMYKTRIVTRLLGWSPLKDRRIREWFEARTLFAKACRVERDGSLASAAILYEQALELNPNHHMARFQLARLLHHGLKNGLAAKKHYAVLRKKLHHKHAYYMESVEAITKIDRDGLA